MINKMSRLTKPLFALAILLAGCSQSKNYEVHVLDSGNEVRIQSMGVIHFSEGEPALMLKYLTDIPFDDISKLRAEADDIWHTFVHNVEDANLTVGVLSAQTPEDKVLGSLITKNESYNFIWVKQEDSTWKSYEADKESES